MVTHPSSVMPTPTTGHLEECHNRNVLLVNDLNQNVNSAQKFAFGNCNNESKYSDKEVGREKSGSKSFLTTDGLDRFDDISDCDKDRSTKFQTSKILKASSTDSSMPSLCYSSENSTLQNDYLVVKATNKKIKNDRFERSISWTDFDTFECSIDSDSANSEYVASYEVPSVFDRLHNSASREKELEGKKRREELARRQHVNKLYRSGAMCKKVKKIPIERGSDMYYRGMIHLLKKERLMAAQHEGEQPFQTKLNLQQIHDYCVILKNSPEDDYF